MVVLEGLGTSFALTGRTAKACSPALLSNFFLLVSSKNKKNTTQAVFALHTHTFVITHVSLIGTKSWAWPYELMLTGKFSFFFVKQKSNKWPITDLTFRLLQVDFHFNCLKLAVFENAC